MKEPKNLFDLDNLSNYRSLNYMSSTVIKLQVAKIKGGWIKKCPVAK